MLLFSTSTKAQGCPTWYQICFTKVDEYGCCALYEADIQGDFTSSSTIGPVNIQFGIFPGYDGTITDIQFIDPNDNYYSDNGVQIDIANTKLTGGSNMAGDEFNSNDLVLIELCGEIDDDLLVYNTFFAFFADGVVCNQFDQCDGIPTPTPVTANNVSGTINTPGYYAACTNTTNNGIENVDIQVSTMFGIVCNTETDNEGEYSCSSCEYDYPFTICASEECPIACGLTQYDITLIENHILGIPPLTYIEQEIAADVNMDGNITAGDVGLLQKELDNLPNSVENWCRFYPEDDLSFLGGGWPGDNCLVADKPLSKSTDFHRILLGDVDGTCTDCVHDDNTGDIPIVLFYNSKGEHSFSFLEKNEIYNIALDIPVERKWKTMTIESPLKGFQFIEFENHIKFRWTAKSVEQSYTFDGLQPILTIKSEESTNIKLGDFVDSWVTTTQGISKARKSKLEQKEIQIGSYKFIYISSECSEIDIKVFNLSGQLIDENQFSIKGDQNYLPYELLGPTGIYYMMIDDGMQVQSIRIFNIMK